MTMPNNIKRALKKPTDRESVVRLPPHKMQMAMLEDGQKIDWGIKMLGVDKLWEITKGDGVRILIIDTGMPGHCDVNKNLIPELCFDATGEGKADMNGHSTFVSSILCGNGGSGSGGVIGYAPNAKFFTAKALNGRGCGDIAWTTKCLEYAVANSDKFDLVNMSLGAPVAVMKQHLLIKELWKRNKPVFCAAGNFQKGKSVDTISYPAAYPEVIAIGAFDSVGNLAPFSSWGKEVDFAFPGVDNIGCGLNQTYVHMSGTSFACPAACGLAALIIARHRAQGKLDCQTVPQLMSHFLKFAVDKGVPGVDNKWGNGTIDVSKLFESELK